MPRTLLPIALLFALPAWAGTLEPAVESATAPGVVDVPLYAGPGAEDPFFYVEAMAGESPLLLRVATGHNQLRLTTAAATALGVKIHGKEGAQTAEVDSLTLGGATLTDIDVNIAEITASGAVPVDGELGLPALSDLAWALLPSQGVLRLAPAATGLPAGATKFPTADFDALREEKVKVGSEKQRVPGAPIALPVSWSGTEVLAGWKVEEGHSWVAREVEGGFTYTMKGVEKPTVKLPAAPTVQEGETPSEYRVVRVAGTDVATSVMRVGQGPIWFFAVNAAVGIDVAGHFDLVVNPAQHEASLTPVTATRLADYAPRMEARLKKAIDVAGKEAETDVARADAKRAATVPYADWLHARGQFDAEVAVRKQIAEGDPDVCTGWTYLGAAWLAAGHPAEAVDALTRADTLYAAWAPLPLEERRALEEDYAEAKKKQATWTGTVPQDHACHVAPGLIAEARLQQRDFAAVAALYPARLDLDPTLPRAAGIAALQSGDTERAQAAFRQAEKLDGPGSDAASRTGLFFAYQKANPQLAQEQLEAIRFAWQGQTDPVLVRLYAEALRPSGKAVQALQSALAADPSDAVLLTQLGLEQALAGDTGGASASFGDAEKRLKERLALAPQNGRSWAAYSHLLLAAGRVEEARTAADNAVRLSPEAGTAWLALAEVEAAAGDPTKAGEHRARARALWVTHPAYAALAQD
jgi:cytochrome c-type biogenesis protein CcmH/NrfG